MYVQLKLGCNAVVIFEMNGPCCLDPDSFRLVSDIVRSTAAAGVGNSAVW